MTDQAPDTNTEQNIRGLFQADDRLSFEDFRAFFMEDSGNVTYAEVLGQADVFGEEVSQVLFSDEIGNKEVKSAHTLINENVLKRTLTGNPLFFKLGRNTLQKLFEEAEICVVPSGDVIVGPDTDVQGMLIPTEELTIEVQDSVGNFIMTKDLVPGLGGNYVGEYAMVGIRPTATVVNRSSETSFIYISNKLFKSLHPRSRQEIREVLLANSPLLDCDAEDTVNHSRSTKEIVAYSHERSDVPKLIIQLTLKKHAHDVFKPHYLESYKKGDRVSPKELGYLGFIVGGKLSVYHRNISKIAEIAMSNTIFESNAVGIAPSTSKSLLAENDDTRVLWINLSPDDEYYESLLEVAVDGQAAKLNIANIRIAEIQKR